MHNLAENADISYYKRMNKKLGFLEKKRFEAKMITDEPIKLMKKMQIYKNKTKEEEEEEKPLEIEISEKVDVIEEEVEMSEELRSSPNNDEL